MEESVRLQIIYETAVSMVTRTPEAWAEYLRFASRFYKYPFDNALLRSVRTNIESAWM
ncbi:hypothetical protein Dtox_0419 [Desulfofarcimen acetoxidans DSM 771]|uniref:Uncharacterized protein n=1 Tax=Desulfofarcimen acetoxidans (strain ATCC 49208 / DSM 771 / KCTC 5769 / VKM B-1644 / 5575) TaxID=485916 RepID=C8W505_DESAS|nr:hypothetical protein [Desulfofarcimen acetoxidans]ACV61357.1 hypothetical protein Dtox_0419 [Desulfofarcimen acetoxidans DSM 771]